MRQLDYDVSGILVGVSDRPYKGGLMRDGSTLAPGTSRHIYVSATFSDEPVKIRVRDAVLFGQAAAAGFGASVVAECSVKAQQSTGDLSLDADDLKVTKPVSAPVSPASNGSVPARS